MIEEKGIVRRVDGDRIQIEVQRRSACGGCSAGGSCGTSVLAGLFGRKALHIWLPNALDAQPGDTLVVGLRDEAQPGLSARAYLWPLLALLVGGGIGDALGTVFFAADTAAELLSIVGASAGLVAALAYQRHSSASALRAPGLLVVLRKEPSLLRVVT